jgi:FAD/FMN-containing dehydrogenase
VSDPALSEIAALEAAIEGTVAAHGSPEYDRVRAPVWAQFEDVRPQAIVLCRTPEDVAEAIAFARRVGVEIAVRSGGHCFAGRSTTRGILIDLRQMRSVAVSDGVATVGAGALLGDLYEELDGSGLTIPAGSCPGVGIAGLTLGGGLGVLGRKYGLTADQLVRAGVVLADGRIVDCDEHRDAGLFWALRGAGGGQLGVVTNVAFKTVPAGDLTCFKLLWPWERAAAAIEVWQAWAPDAADELAASLLVTAHGLDAPVVTLFGSMLGDAADTARLLDQMILRLGADPSPSTVEQMSHRAATRFLAEHSPSAEQQSRAAQAAHARPAVMFSKSEFFRRPLPREAIAGLLDAFTADRASGQDRELDFTPWGGAYNRVSPEATAFVHRHERFLLLHMVTLDPEATTQQRDAAHDWLRRSWAGVHPWGSGGVYPNFPDPDVDDWARAYHGANHERLSRVKARYDPDDVFRFHQSALPTRRR